MTRRTITFALLLTGGLFLLLPGIAAVLMGILAIAGAVPDVHGSQAGMAIAAGLFTAALGVVPLAAFFVRKTAKGALLARVTAVIFLILALPFPFTLAVQGPAPWVLLVYAVLGIWVFTGGLDETPAGTV